METKVRRRQLHEKLCDILGSRQVYFQSPGKQRMEYPSIIYKRATNRAFRADNKRYLAFDAYEITYVSEYPDDDMPDIIDSSFDHIRRENRYTADGLYHDSFYLYF